jgi:hypothetical protein
LHKACVFSSYTCKTFSRSILKYKCSWLHQTKCFGAQMDFWIKARQLAFFEVGSKHITSINRRKSWRQEEEEVTQQSNYLSSANIIHLQSSSQTNKLLLSHYILDHNSLSLLCNHSLKQVLSISWSKTKTHINHNIKPQKNHTIITTNQHKKNTITTKNKTTLIFLSFSYSSYKRYIIFLFFFPLFFSFYLFSFILH